jgi:hypothetical protein
LAIEILLLGSTLCTTHFASAPGHPGALFLLFPAVPHTILGCAHSTVIRTFDTNRVGPLSLAQWNGRDFLFSPLAHPDTQFGEPVDARLVPGAFFI